MTQKQARIVIEDLPEAMTAEEMKALFGAGLKYRKLEVEALESRELMATLASAAPISVGSFSASASAPASVIQVEYQHVGGKTGVLGAATSAELTMPGGRLQHFQF